METMDGSAARSFLLASQDASGGWAYAPGQAPSVEPTAMVMNALSAFPGGAEDAQAVQRAVEWLLAGQIQDGGWGIYPEDLQGCWLTAWAVLALSSSFFLELPTEQMKLAVEQGAAWLLQVEALQFEDAELLGVGSRVAGIDFSLRGWPWQPGEASWVEPTALALLALTAAGFTLDEPRLAEAVQYLVDRRCPGGGWNVGNPRMFNALLPAHAHPTAWALLALEMVAPDQILPEDLANLKAEMRQDQGTMALAWGLAALLALKQEDEEMRSWLASRQLEDGSWDHNPYWTALAFWALEARF